MNSTGIYECEGDPQTSQSHTEIKPIVTSNITTIARPGFLEQPPSNAGVFYSISTIPGQAVVANVDTKCLRSLCGFKLSLK